MQGIEVKDAVKRAKTVLLDLLEDEPPKELALEGVERTTDGDRDVWVVTLGFFRRKSINPIRAPSDSLIGDYLAPSPIENRDYKTIQIDAKTGDFVKMDIRAVQ